MIQGYNLRNKRKSPTEDIDEKTPSENNEEKSFLTDTSLTHRAETDREAVNSDFPDQSTLANQPFPSLNLNQLRALYMYYDIQQSPSKNDCILIAKRINVRPKDVAIWFSQEKARGRKFLEQKLQESNEALPGQVTAPRSGAFSSVLSGPGIPFGAQNNFQPYPFRPKANFNRNRYGEFYDKGKNWPSPSPNSFDPWFPGLRGFNRQKISPLAFRGHPERFASRRQPQSLQYDDKSPFDPRHGYGQTIAQNQYSQYSAQNQYSQKQPFSHSNSLFGQMMPSRRGRGRGRGSSLRRQIGSSRSDHFPPPPTLPKPKDMVQMIKEAIKDLNEGNTKTNKINIKTWIKEHYDISFYADFQDDFNRGLNEGTRQSLFYEFSNSFRLTSSLLEEHQKSMNIYSDEEAEASCPIPTPLPEGTKARRDALRGFIMGEILSQEPHYSLQRKGIIRRIETMTPTEFKDWALYEVSAASREKIEEEAAESVKESEEKENGGSGDESSEAKEPPPRRTLRKTPTRLLKEQMARFKKHKPAFLYESSGKRLPYHADEVLRELVASRRLAIWLKPKDKRSASKKRVYFATKKSIQWKSCGYNLTRIAPFSRPTPEEDAFFSSSDKHNLSPQEEQKKRAESKEAILKQIDDYKERTAKFFVKNQKIFAPFISKKYMASAKAISKKAPRKSKARNFGDLPLERQPPAICGTLRPYQLAGVNWLAGLYDKGLCGILGDEMGLGKTLQTIAFLTHLKSRGIDGPHLIVCPLNVLTNWCNEFSRFSPEMTVVRFHGPERELNRVLRDRLDIGSFDVIVTTFEMVLTAENVLLRRFNYQCVVVDEAHRVKNEQAQISESLRRVTSFFKLLLTGTPLQNNLRELWSLLNFLYPVQFDSSGTFDSGFNLIGNKVNVDTMWASKQVLKLLMLRRLKAEVANLPPKSETKVKIPMSECQVFWYKRLLAYQGRNLINAKKEVREQNSMKKLISIIMELRKCCNHPFLFPNCEPDFNDEGYGEKIIECCGKMQVLDKMLIRLKENGHRVLIFSQFTSVLDIIEDYCRFRKWSYLRLDGRTNRVQRQFDISRFNKPGSSTFLYLITTRAGGLGVNLHTADTVIMYDSDWNPQADLQAQDRAHRIGQTRPVRVFRFITEGTIEERVAMRAEKKLFLDAVVTAHLDNSTDAKGLGAPRKTKGKRRRRRAEKEPPKSGAKPAGKKALLGMLTFGAERVFNAKGAKVSDEDVDLILGLKRARCGKNARAKLESGSERNAADFDFRAGPLKITRFQGEEVQSEGVGEDYSGRDALERIAAEWAEFNGRSAQFQRGKEKEVSSLDYAELKYKRFFGHEAICHSCKQEGLLLLCEWCPRSYHHECLGYDSVPEGSFKCPQHKCDVCFRSAHEAGGMLFRCVSCPHCSCEDHLCHDIVPVDKCEALEAFGYKKSTSAFYVLCSKDCEKNEKARAEKLKEKSESDQRDQNSKEWDSLPNWVGKRLRMGSHAKGGEQCNLGELDHFSARIEKVDPDSPLLQALHNVLYGVSHSQIVPRLVAWKGLRLAETPSDEEKNKMAAFYHRTVREFTSWRQHCLLYLSKLLGIWTRSEPRKINGGALSGRMTKPKDRNVSAVDSEAGIASHIALFLCRPSVARQFVHHNILQKHFDPEFTGELEDVLYEKSKASEENESLESLEDRKASRVEKAPGSESLDLAEDRNAPRQVVWLKRLGEGTFEFVKVEQRLPRQLRPRRKRKVWEDYGTFEDEASE